MSYFNLFFLAEIGFHVTLNNNLRFNSFQQMSLIWTTEVFKELGAETLLSNLYYCDNWDIKLCSHCCSFLLLKWCLYSTPSTTPHSCTLSAAATLLPHTHLPHETLSSRSNKCTCDSPSATLQSDSLSVCGAQNGGMKTLKELSCPFNTELVCWGFGPN